MSFESEYFKNATDLAEARRHASSKVESRRKDLEKIRRSSNGMALLTEEEAEEMGREEIVNHLLSYAKLLQLESMYKSMVTGTKSLAEIIVKTGNAEADMETGATVSRVINDGIFNFRRKFKNFWSKCAGEIVIAGGVPACYPDSFGWLPEVRPDMVFPPETDLETDQVPFCFAPVSFNLLDLEEMIRENEADDDNEDSMVNIENLKKLAEILKDQPDDRLNAFPSHRSNITRSTREDEDEESSDATIDAWEYFEVKVDEDDGSLFVSKTIFVEQDSLRRSEEDTGKSFSKKLNKDDEASDTLILTYDEKAFDNVFDWLAFVAVDSEIGGIKDISTMRGVAELTFDSSQDIEDLLNLMIQGDKIRAVPKMQLQDDANIGQIAKWDITRDLVAPKGLAKLDIDATTSHLQTPMSILDGGASAIAGAPTGMTGESGQLRVEALNQQQVTGNIQANRLGEAYDCLDMILEMIVYRVLMSEPEPGTDGYNEIKWTQEKLEEEGIDRKMLGERKYGRFRWIEVRAQRNIANGDRHSQIETAEWLMANLPQFAPQVRPIIIRLATQLRTQDPHLAETLVQIPKVILNQQKVIAENEYDLIERRSSIGQAVSVGADDIHQDHIPVHLKDMQTLLARHDIRPWDKDDVLTFTGLAEHLAEHLEILLGAKGTINEAAAALQDYQKLVNAAQGPVSEVEEREQQQEQGANSIPLEKQIQLEQKDQELMLKARQIGVAEANQERLTRLNERNTRMKERSSMFKELVEARKLQMAQEQRTQPPTTQN